MHVTQVGGSGMGTCPHRFQGESDAGIVSFMHFLLFYTTSGPLALSTPQEG